LIDGGVQLGLEPITGFQLVGDGPEVWLKVRDRLAGSDQFVECRNGSDRRQDLVSGRASTLAPCASPDHGRYALSA
jgi:hypothetical protein